MLIEQRVVDLAEREFRIEVQARLELLGGKFARTRAESIAQFGEPRLVQREAGGHLVSAVLFQQAGAARECGDEREAFDAASAAFTHALVVEADDERRAIMLLLQPRRDDADHARMPAPRPDHDRCIARRIEPLR